MEENPTAAVENTTEANQPIEQTAQTQQPVQNPNTITLTDEQMKFFSANGGLEKIFPKIKDAISNPQQRVETTVEKTPEPTVAQTAQVQAPSAQDGYITPQEFYAQQYFNSLASDEKYAGISNAIRSGDILKEMASFNINPLDQYGNINDAMVRRFLDLKAQTVPAQPTNLESSSATPTVTYTEVGDEITTREDALKVLSEPGHPKHDAAMAFMRKDIWKK